MTTAIPGMTDRIREQIYDHVFATPDREVGGVLVGNRSDGGLVVRHIVPALEAEGDSTSLTFTHEAWSRILAEMDRDEYRGQQIVGWYHSHPGHGIFLSDQDLFIHRHFFGDPSNVAYVIDPLNGREGMFGWSGGEIVKHSESDTRRAPVTVPHVAPWIPARGRSAGYPLSGYLVPAVVGLALGGVFALAVASSAGSDAPATAAPAMIEVAPPQPDRSSAKRTTSREPGVPPNAEPRYDTDPRDFSPDSGASPSYVPSARSGTGGSKGPASSGNKGVPSDSSTGGTGIP